MIGQMRGLRAVGRRPGRGSCCKRLARVQLYLCGPPAGTAPWPGIRHLLRLPLRRTITADPGPASGSQAAVPGQFAAMGQGPATAAERDRGGSRQCGRTARPRRENQGTVWIEHNIEDPLCLWLWMPDWVGLPALVTQHCAARLASTSLREQWAAGIRLKTDQHRLLFCIRRDSLIICRTRSRKRPELSCRSRPGRRRRREVIDGISGSTRFLQPLPASPAGRRKDGSLLEYL